MADRKGGDGLAWSRWLTVTVGFVVITTAIGLPWIQSFKWGKDGFELVTAQKTTTTLDELQKSVAKLNADVLDLAQATKKIAAELEAVIAAQPPEANVAAAAAQASWLPTLRTLGEIVDSATANTAAIQKVAGAVSSLKAIVYDADPKP